MLKKQVWLIYYTKKKKRLGVDFHPPPPLPYMILFYFVLDELTLYVLQNVDRYKESIGHAVNSYRQGSC